MKDIDDAIARTQEALDKRNITTARWWDRIESAPTDRDIWDIILKNQQTILKALAQIMDRGCFES